MKEEAEYMYLLIVSHVEIRRLEYWNKT